MYIPTSILLGLRCQQISCMEMYLSNNYSYPNILIGSVIQTDETGCQFHENQKLQ